MEKFLAVAPLTVWLSGVFSFLVLSFLIYFVRGTLYVNTKEKERPPGLEQRLLVAFALASVMVLCYESYALVSGHALIAHSVASAIAEYAPVAWFCGLAAMFFLTIAVFKTKAHWGLRCLSALWLIGILSFFSMAGAQHAKSERTTPAAQTDSQLVVH